MSEFHSKKVSVLIASTLKPILDVRAFGKLAFSLGETNTYRVFIIGFSAKRPISIPGFRFFSSMSHFDSRVDRILAQVRFGFRVIQVRPKILICCTYEYLLLASFLKRFLGYKLIYDVQENYRANLDLNPALSPKSKSRLSRVIRKAESVDGIDLFLLAEKCYQSEMPDKHPFLILENKFKGEILPRGPIIYLQKKGIRYCITGTITPAFGVWDAVCWFEEIQKKYPDTELEIIGHCPIDSFRKQLRVKSEINSRINLKISRNPIAHAYVIEAIQRSDFALLPYQNQPSISDKMPTKLFECAALGTPVLISPNPIWIDFLAPFQGGVAIDFIDHSKAIGQFETALNHTFFLSTPPESVLWKTESLDLQQAVQNLLS
jgi:glycosyltransferase involved in cell wall biosynthesis